MTDFRYTSTVLLATDLCDPKAVGDGKLGDVIPDEARAAVKCVKSETTPLPEFPLEYLIVSITDWLVYRGSGGRSFLSFRTSVS